MKLPSELKKRINRFSHAAGVAHGEQIKILLLADLEAMAEPDWQAMAWNDGALEAWLESHCVVLPDDAAEAGRGS